MVVQQAAEAATEAMVDLMGMRVSVGLLSLDKILV